MQNIVRIKEVLGSIGSLAYDYSQCQEFDKTGPLRKNLSSVKKQLLDAYTPAVSERFACLDPVLHNLFNQHFNSLVLSIGDLQEIHDTKSSVQHIDTDVFHNLLITHIHLILRQIDQRLLAMNSTLNGLGVVAKRKP